MQNLTVAVFAALSVLARGAAPAGDNSDDSTVAVSTGGGAMFLDNSPFDKLPSWIQFGVHIRWRFEGVSGTSITNNA